MRSMKILSLAAVLVAGAATGALSSEAQPTGGATNRGKATPSVGISSGVGTTTTDGNDVRSRGSTTGGPATVNPTGSIGTGTAPDPKSSSTGNAATGAGAAGGESSSSATNNGH
jgi:hypothetical protein